MISLQNELQNIYFSYDIYKLYYTYIFNYFIFSFVSFGIIGSIPSALLLLASWITTGVISSTKHLGPTIIGGGADETS